MVKAIGVESLTVRLTRWDFDSAEEEQLRLSPQ